MERRYFLISLYEKQKQPQIKKTQNKETVEFSCRLVCCCHGSSKSPWRHRSTVLSGNNIRTFIYPIMLAGRKKAPAF